MHRDGSPPRSWACGALSRPRPATRRSLVQLLATQGCAPPYAQSRRTRHPPTAVSTELLAAGTELRTRRTPITAARHSPPTASFGRPPEYDEQLDLSREQFDFLSLKSFRRDALLQYDATNQSEPLRIILSFLGILFCLCLPTLNSEAGLENGLVTDAIAVAGAAGSGFLFVTNRAARSARIERISREYAMGDLRALYRGVRNTPLRDVRGKLRVVALCGARDVVDAALVEAYAYRNRLAQARVAVVPVYASGDGIAATGGEENTSVGAGRPAGGRGYFDGGSRRATSTGRRARGWRSTSRGGARVGRRDAAVGRAPGTALQPSDRSGFGELEERETVTTAAADAAAAAAAAGVVGAGGEAREAAEADAAAVLEAQTGLLCRADGRRPRGDGGAGEGAADEPAVSEVLGGGRLDPWPSQLSEASRPAGMRATDRDALIVAAADEAWTTAVERPAAGGTLLATQRRRRAPDGGGWRLSTHRTIPWDAGGGTAVARPLRRARPCRPAREINTRAS